MKINAFNYVRENLKIPVGKKISEEKSSSPTDKTSNLTPHIFQEIAGNSKEGIFHEVIFIDKDGNMDEKSFQGNLKGNSKGDDAFKALAEKCLSREALPSLAAIFVANRITGKDIF